MLIADQIDGFLKEFFEFLLDMNQCIEVWIGCFDNYVDVAFVRCFSGGVRSEYSYVVDAVFF